MRLMNRDQRQQLRAIADEVSGWVKIAAPVRAQRREAANASSAARTALLGSVIDVAHHGVIAWRVLPLRNTDNERLQKMAHYQGLPRISAGFRDTLRELVEEIPAVVHRVRT